MQILAVKNIASLDSPVRAFLTTVASFTPQCCCFEEKKVLIKFWLFFCWDLAQKLNCWARGCNKPWLVLTDALCFGTMPHYTGQPHCFVDEPACLWESWGTNQKRDRICSLTPCCLFPQDFRSHSITLSLLHCPSVFTRDGDKTSDSEIELALHQYVHLCTIELIELID